MKMKTLSIMVGTGAVALGCLLVGTASPPLLHAKKAWSNLDMEAISGGALCHVYGETRYCPEYGSTYCWVHHCSGSVCPYPTKIKKITTLYRGPCDHVESGGSETCSNDPFYCGSKSTCTTCVPIAGGEERCNGTDPATDYGLRYTYVPGGGGC